MALSLSSNVHVQKVTTQNIFFKKVLRKCGCNREKVKKFQE